MNDDTISRAAAIDAIDVISWYHQNQHGEMVHGASDEEQAWYKAEDIYTAIESVPSAQPEITNEEIRFALKQLRVYLAIKIRDGKDGGVPVELLKCVEEIQKYFENVPSAEPEYTEQDVRDAFNDGYRCGMESAQPEIMRCKDCRHNNDCEIQYSAQSGDEFFCGCAEGKDNG